MSQVLRQSTQVIVVIGPFVDVGDAFTPEIGVTLSGADEAEILKANTATTTSISGATWAAITGCDGYYALTLTTSLTDTVGPLTVMVNDDSVCLPVFARFQVIEEAAYDAIYAASASPATAAGVSAVETDTQDIQGRLPAALVNSRMDCTIDGTGMETGAVDSILNRDASASTTNSTLGAIINDWEDGGRLDTIGDAILVDTAEIGAAGAGLTAINLPDQTMNITGDITGNLSGSVGSVTGAVGSVTGNVGGNVTGSVGSLATQAKADVNAEVVDTLNVDTYAEIGQETPAATNTIRKMLGFLFKAWRNRSTQTATAYSLYADDGTTVDQKSTVSDDATTFDSGEKTTGP
jgi:hypothetical protein